jgi:hypothetical protein
VFALLSLGMVLSERRLGRLLLLAAVGFALLVAYSLGYLRSGPQGLIAALRQRRRTRALLQRLDAVGGELQAAPDLLAVQAVVAGFAAALERPLRLTLDASAPAAALAKDGDETAARYPVGTRAGILGHLELTLPAAALGPDERTLIQLLCDQLAPVLLRLLRPQEP